MKLLIDRNGLQAYHHLKDKHRLGTIITAFMAAKHHVVFSPSGLTIEALDWCDVLVGTTSKTPYSQSEIEAICQFVNHGGGLLILSNHGDCPGRNSYDARVNDSALAREFGITIEQTFFAHELDGQFTTLSGDTLKHAHPIISGGARGKPIRSLATNTCCSIVAPEGDWIARLPNTMEDKRDGSSPQDRFFAHALDSSLESEPECKGRIVIVADSGLVGTEGTMYPGLGLIGLGDNLQFLWNVILWLGRHLG